MTRCLTTRRSRRCARADNLSISISSQPSCNPWIGRVKDLIRVAGQDGACASARAAIIHLYVVTRGARNARSGGWNSTGCTMCVRCGRARAPQGQAKLSIDNIRRSAALFKTSETVNAHPDPRRERSPRSRPPLGLATISQRHTAPEPHVINKIVHDIHDD